MKGKRTTSRSRQPVLPLWQEEGTTRAAIDYKRLRRINPQAARHAVLEYLASVNGNVGRQQEPLASPARWSTTS